MKTDQPAPAAALDRLQPFLGEWIEQVAVPETSPGRMVFEWTLDRTFLLQRSEIPNSPFPDSTAIIGVDANGQTYTQHYFDSRGVARVYAMTFDGGRWTLVRDAPDFTPLEFFQRFTGTFAEDGDSIDGGWETSDDGVHWERDFDLTYTIVTLPGSP